LDTLIIAYSLKDFRLAPFFDFFSLVTMGVYLLIKPVLNLKCVFYIAANFLFHSVVLVSWLESKVSL
jgi:hypothetical protein